jgi:ATP-dependent Lon protease
MVQTFSAPKTQKLLGRPIIFVISPPGCGKGTLCTYLCEMFPMSFRYLSVGD